MTVYILRRLLISIPVFFGITLLVFAILGLAPGDPVAMMVPREALAAMSPEEYQAVRRAHGLDRPLGVRYLYWLRETAGGNLGQSLLHHRPVRQEIEARLWPTIKLTGAAMLIGITIGLPVGTIMALRQHSILDYALATFTFASISMPTFFLGLGCIYLFAVNLQILPTSGMHTLGAPRSLGDSLAHLVMPATILGLIQSGVWARYARSSVIEARNAEHVMVARAKGLREQIVVLRHVLRNALLPVITVVGLSIPELLGGAVIVERIFQWPGMGMLAVEASLNRDFPVLMGITMVAAVIVLVTNLVVDVAYAFADPRIRFA